MIILPKRKRVLVILTKMIEILIPDIGKPHVDGKWIQLIENDLILIGRPSFRPQIIVNSAEFGVFRGLDNATDSLVINPLYIMNRSKTFGGEYVRLMTEAPKKMHKRTIEQLYDRFYNELKFSNLTYPKIFSGQEDIAKALESWPGFEPHAEWVDKLRRPY